jgi:hypothetical protein
MKRIVALFLVFVTTALAVKEIRDNDFVIGALNSNTNRVWQFGNGNTNKAAIKFDYTRSKLTASHDNVNYFDLGTATLQNIPFSYIGNSNYTNLYDYLNIISASGYVSGGTITATGSNTVSVSAGEGMVRKLNTSIDDMTFIVWSTTTGITITSDVINYLYVDYNAGTPIVATTTDITAINRNTQIVLGLAYTDGHETAHVVNAGLNVTNWIQNQHIRLTETRRVERASGIDYSETGQRYLYRTSGVAYLAGNRTTYSVMNTSGTDRFTYIYRNGSGGWTEVSGQQQIDNTRYDSGTGTLATISVGRYGVHWVYTLADGQIYVLYGQGNYTLTNAQNATVPNPLPVELSGFATLSAKIIILRNATNVYSIASAYTTLFPVSSPSDHNDLVGLQGGQTDQYYHLNANKFGHVNSNTYPAIMIQNNSNTVYSSSTTTYPVTLYNTYNAAAMTGVGTGIFFQQNYYDATTPAPKILGGFAYRTDTNWTSTQGTQNASFSLYLNQYFNTPKERIILYGYNSGNSTRFPEASTYSFGGTASSSTPYAYYHFYPGSNVAGYKDSGYGAPGYAINPYTNTSDSNNFYTDFISWGNQAGSNIRLLTNPTGASAAIERMRLTSSGLMGLAVTNPSAIAHLGAGNANNAPLKINAGTLTTNAQSGAVEFDGNAFYQSLNTNFRQASSGIIFSQTSDKTVANSTTETTALDGGVGSITIPANSLSVGKVIRITLRGSLGNTGGPSATIRVKLGSVTLIENTATLPTLSTNSPFDFTYDIVTRSTGSTGTVYSIGRSFVVTATGPFMRGLDGGLDNINTQTNNNIDVTYQWGTADPANTITINTATIEVLY